MDKDVIILYYNCDFTLITLNGKNIGELEYHYDIIDILPKLFDKLEHSYNTPIILEIEQDEYFRDAEVEALFEIDYCANIETIFTEKEVEIAKEKGIEECIKAIKSRIEIRANEIDKEMQEM